MVIVKWGSGSDVERGLVDEDCCSCSLGMSAGESAGAFVSGKPEGPYLVSSLDGVGPLLPALRFENFGSANRRGGAH
jgi:hypothetical protein